MEQIRLLAPAERVRLDHERLQALYDEMGDSGAEDVVCRAMEELAVRLAKAEKLHRRGDHAELRRLVKSLVGIADQIGMSKLARVASDVAFCIEIRNQVALGATFSRLLRIGERSLSAIWDAEEFCP